MPYHTLLYHQVQAMVDDYLVIGFSFAVIFDIITGYVKAWFAKLTNRKTNSTKGLFGLVKHSIVLTGMLALYPYLISIGFDWVAQSLMAFLLYNYLVSIVENLGEIGVPIPDWLSKRLTKLQTDYNAKDYNPVTGDYKDEQQKEDK